MNEIYPKAKISSIKKYAVDASYVRGGLRKYDTKQFIYTYDSIINEINAMHKPTKQMFTWSSKTRKWKKISYSYKNYLEKR